MTVKGGEIVDADPIRLAIEIEVDRRVAVSKAGPRKRSTWWRPGTPWTPSRITSSRSQWDGVPRVDAYFERAYDAVAMAFADNVGDHPRGRRRARHANTAAFVSKSFLIGLAARALDPGCKVDTMPILIGDQGLNKSESFRTLCPDPDWFTDDIGDIHTKDACANLKGVLIVEFAEFNRLMRASRRPPPSRS